MQELSAEVNNASRVGSNFRIIPEQYFSEVENVAEFLENIDNNLTYYEIPTQLACAYLKGHLIGWALDWFEVLGFRVVENKATDYFVRSVPRGIGRKIGGKREVTRYSDNCRLRREFNRFEGQVVADNRRFDGRRRGGQSDHRFHNPGIRQGGSRNSAFRDSEPRTIRVSSLRTTPVDLPYVPILLNETFITALWDTGAEKSFISEEVYPKYFSYRPRQKTKVRVVRPNGLMSLRSGRITDSDPRISEKKPGNFAFLTQYAVPIILGIDFMNESKFTFDFDQKSLIIPDNQIKQLPKVEKPVEINLSDIKLGEGQKQKLRRLVNDFKGLFSD
ncbi:uncharacterized protein TNCV_2349541 [Trichonephila clavipes]|uniref:Peptidase A2 domain-containing protein n=1 Tax=Trichonephila clavipes TaxID=2585209 RepID=A0A8X6VKK9_TRICX|nr:uncharacterized protein TNCV_2349541 [Trichonephila clavipes]